MNRWEEMAQLKQPEHEITMNLFAIFYEKPHKNSHLNDKQALQQLDLETRGLKPKCGTIFQAQILFHLVKALINPAEFDEASAAMKHLVAR